MKKQPNERARFEVLMEEVQSQLTIVAEGHSGLDRKIDSVRETLEQGMGILEQGMGILGQRMGMLEQKVEHGFATLGQRIGFVESAVLDVRGDIKRRFDEHLSAHAA